MLPVAQALMIICFATSSPVASDAGREGVLLLLLLVSVVIVVVVVLVMRMVVIVVLAAVALRCSAMMSSKSSARGAVFYLGLSFAGITLMASGLGASVYNSASSRQEGKESF
jgi:hypothetical protein